MKRLILLGIMLSFLPTAQAAPQHALVKGLTVAVAPVTHPRRTLKVVLGSVLFGVEVGVDAARGVATVADKAFDAVSVEGRVPALDMVAVALDVAVKDTAKLDGWLERQEDYLFGSHN